MTALARVILPWSKTSDFSLNARTHWATRQRRVKAQKETTTLLAKQAGWHRVTPPEGAINMRLTFCPPSRGGYPDGDNVLAANKGALDALAALWGVDDRRFRIIIEHGERCQFGAVIVTAEAP